MTPEALLIRIVCIADALAYASWLGAYSVAVPWWRAGWMSRLLAFTHIVFMVMTAAVAVALSGITLRPVALEWFVPLALGALAPAVAAKAQIILRAARAGRARRDRPQPASSSAGGGSAPSARER